MKYVALYNEVFKILTTEEQGLCRAYEEFINKKIAEQLDNEDFRNKFAEAIAFGLPYYIDKELNIKTLTKEEGYKNGKDR